MTLKAIGRKPEAADKRRIRELEDALAELQEREKARDKNWKPKNDIKRLR